MSRPQVGDMLIIFDVDGTLLGGESHDWASYDRALEVVLGFVPSPEFFSGLSDITAETIAEAAIRAAGRNPDRTLVAEIRDTYLKFLKEAHLADPDAFPLRKGVSSLLEHLKSQPDVAVAVATGDWLPTISFKLQCAGLSLSGFPTATASDAHRRSEIIRLAAVKARRPLAEALYIGDGTWDLRACRELGIPFVGTGDRTDKLLAAGAERICEHLEVEPFTKVLESIACPEQPLISADRHARAEPPAWG